MANIGDAINTAGKIARRVKSSYVRRAMKTGAYKTAKFNAKSAQNIAKGSGVKTFRQVGNAEKRSVLKTQIKRKVATDAAVGAGVVAAGVGINKRRKRNA